MWIRFVCRCTVSGLHDVYTSSSMYTIYVVVVVAVVVVVVVVIVEVCMFPS